MKPPPGGSAGSQERSARATSATHTAVDPAARTDRWRERAAANAWAAWRPSAAGQISTVSTRRQRCGGAVACASAAKGTQ